MTDKSPQDVLTFWRDAGPSKWYKKDAEFDADMTAQFGATHAAAANGDLDGWADQPDSALALIIVLDQFSRNMFRNDAKAFAQDVKTQKLVETVMANGVDEDMPADLRVFCYLPLMHSEELHHQEKCLETMKKLGYDNNVKYAQEHLEIIEKFGRFPHRNPVLNRQTTNEEQEFLDGGGFAG